MYFDYLPKEEIKDKYPDAAGSMEVPVDNYDQRYIFSNFSKAQKIVFDSNFGKLVNLMSTYS
ncbi:MAG: hypothetical protein Q4F54_05090 [Coriobacteriia bacterium]|nr:hypothetical protein [Coriobacteriia bacterium]